MFNISENIMQMIFITIDEDSKENTGIDLNDEKKYHRNSLYRMLFWLCGFLFECLQRKRKGLFW